MNTSEFIKKYCEKNTKPDPEYCPQLILYWNGHNKEHGSYTKRYNTLTGEIKINQQFNYSRIGYDSDEHIAFYQLTPRSYGYDGCYAKVIKDGIIEIAKLRMEDGSRGTEGEIREWRYNNGYYHTGRIFIERDTFWVYDQKGNRLWEQYQGRYYNKEVPKFMNAMNNFVFCLKTSNEFKKFAGTETTRTSWRAEQQIDYPWTFGEWYKRAAERPINDAAKHFMDIDLPERNYNANTIEFFIINENYCVFRCFGSDYRQERYKEKARVYVSSKGKPTVCRLNGNKFEVTSTQFQSVFYCYGDSPNEVGFDNIKDFTCLSWIKGMIDEKEKSTEKVQAVCDILRHPIVEKLYKSGYKNIAKYVTMDYKIQADTKRIFGLEKLNEKQPLIKALQTNKYLLKLIEDNTGSSGNRWSYRRNDYFNISEPLKAYFGDITPLSKETIELFGNGFAKVLGRNSNWTYALDPSRTYQWGYNYEEYIMPDEVKKNIKKLFNVEAREEGTIEIYVDTVGTYRQLRNKPEISFSEYRHREDLQNIHDNLIALLNIQREEDRARWSRSEQERIQASKERFEKLQEKRVKKFEAESDKYMIIMPKDLTELTTEGSLLHHCVGGYLQRHGNGDTNIIFLREKDRPNTPFYTIEVDNSGRVVQIHGKYNCWLGNNPEAIGFVKKWADERNISVSEKILLCKSSGYSSTSDMVDRKYLSMVA